MLASACIVSTVNYSYELITIVIDNVRRWTGNYDTTPTDGYAPSSLPRLIYFESTTASISKKLNLSYGTASPRDVLLEEGPEMLGMLEENE